MRRSENQPTSNPTSPEKRTARGQEGAQSDDGRSSNDLREDKKSEDEKEDYSNKNKNKYPMIWYDPQVDSQENKTLRDSLQKKKPIHYFSQLEEISKFSESSGKSFMMIVPNGQDESRLFQNSRYSEGSKILRLSKFEEKAVWKDIVKDTSIKMTDNFKVFVSCPLKHFKTESLQSPEVSTTSTPTPTPMPAPTPCDVKEIAKYFHEGPLTMWYDPNFDTESSKQELIKIFPIKEENIYSDFQEFVKRISQPFKHPYYLIMKGKVESFEIIDQLDKFKNLKILYIYEASAEFYQVNDNRVKVGKTIQELTPEIEHETQSHLTRKFDLPTFATDSDSVDRSHLFKLHHYLKGFTNFQNRAQAKKDFLDLISEISANVSDNSQKKIISDFQTSYYHYEKDKIIYWYTTESPICRALNNCLRIATADSILYCRFFLKDLERAIQESSQQAIKRYSGLAYRAAFSPKEEKEKISRNIGKEIEMHAFLSFSKDIKVSKKFLSEDPQKKIMITAIILPIPLLELDGQGYAEIENITRYPREEEILFNVKSRFRILEIQIFDKSQQHLLLLYGAHILRKYMTQHNPTITIELDLPNDRVKCDICGTKENLFGFNQGMTRYRCINCLIKNTIPTDIPLIALDMHNHAESNKIIQIIEGIVLTFQNKVGFETSGYKCHDCDGSGKSKYYKWISFDGKNEIKQCLECLDKKKEIKYGILISESSPFAFWTERQEEGEIVCSRYKTELLSKIEKMNEGEVFLEVEDFNRCIEYGHKVLDSLKLQRDQEVEKTRTYDMLGRAYESLGKHDEALEYHLKALDIRKLFEKENHPNLALSYNNLALVYKSLSEDEKALEYSLKALHIQKLAHEQDDLDIAATHNNIASIYNHMEDYQKALEYVMLALKIIKSKSGEKHPQMSIAYNTLAAIHSIKGEYQEALRFLQQAIDIRESISGENDSIIANSYNNLALVSESMEDNKKALEYHYKTLEIRKCIFGNSHPDIAASYNNLAFIFENLEDSQIAIEYYFKALEIRQFIYGDSHPDIAESYQSLATVYENLGEYQKALEYQQKAVQIIKAQKKESDLPNGTVYKDPVSWAGEDKSHIKFLMQPILIDKPYENNVSLN